MSRYPLDTSIHTIAIHFLRQIKTLGGYVLKHGWRETPILFREVSKFKNSERGRNAFVFANGPSLERIDPEKARAFCIDKKFDLIGVNSYISSDFGQIAPPTKYVLSDPAHFGFGCLDGNLERASECSEDVLRLRETAGLIVFVPVGFRRKIDPKLTVVPFSDRESIFSRNYTDIRWPRRFCTMTAYKALQIACFLGYDKIYIAGFDNNYFKTISNDDENQLWEVDSHHYDLRGIRRKIAHPTYDCTNMAEYLISNAMLFRDLYGFPKDRIFNLIGDSLVDAFPKCTALDIYV